MARALALRSGNPALSAGAFTRERFASDAGVMTIGGTVNKTALSLVILVIAAGWTWGRAAGNPAIGGLVMVGAIGALIAAIATVFRHAWAPYTTPIYAALEGLVLGGVSALFEAAYPGIVTQAVFLTFGTLAALLVAYQSGMIRATEKFKLGVMAATGGIALVYLLSFVVGLFGVRIPVIYSNSAFGILFSVFVVVVAALNLVLDFDLIEQGVSRGAPKYMEWYGAFALLVTLVWLYLEILRLLMKLQSRER